jgi:hypothetical protein
MVKSVYAVSVEIFGIRRTIIEFSEINIAEEFKSLFPGLKPMVEEGVVYESVDDAMKGYNIDALIGVLNT